MRELRIAVLTHQIKNFNVFLSQLAPKERQKFKAITRLHDAKGESFLSYLTLWGFERGEDAQEIEDYIKIRITKTAV